MKLSEYFGLANWRRVLIFVAVTCGITAVVVPVCFLLGVLTGDWITR